MIPARRFLIAAGSAVLMTTFIYIIPSRWWLFVVLDGVLAALFFLDYVRIPSRLSVRCRRAFEDVTYQGQPFNVTLEINNPTRRSMILAVNERFRREFTRVPGVRVMRLKPMSESRWTYSLIPSSRGEFEEPVLTVRVLGKLGFAWKEYRIRGTGRVSVYPLLPDADDARKLWHRQREMTAGEHLRRQKGFSTEFYAVREYNPGDDRRLVHWKASARRFRPIVKEHVHTQQGNVAVLLDAGRAMYGRIGPYGKFDYALAAVTALARTVAAMKNTLWGIAFSREIKATFHYQGKGHPGEVVTRLNPLHADNEESEYYHAVETFLKTCKRRSLVMLLTSMMDITRGRFLSGFLMQMIPRHLPVLVNIQDPDLHRIANAYPENLREAWMKFTAMRILAENRLVSQNLRNSGIHVVDVPAERLIFSAVSTYLDLKLREF